MENLDLVQFTKRNVVEQRLETKLVKLGKLGKSFPTFGLGVPQGPRTKRKLRAHF